MRGTHLEVGEVEGCQDFLHKVQDPSNLAGDLAGQAENVAVILREAAHSKQTCIHAPGTLPTHSRRSPNKLTGHVTQPLPHPLKFDGTQAFLPVFIPHDIHDLHLYLAQDWACSEPFSDVDSPTPPPPRPAILPKLLVLPPSSISFSPT